MLLTISTTHRPASDLGFLLHKHPDRVQRFSLSFGDAVVFYPQSTEDQCTACLMLDIDPVDMVRGRQTSWMLDHYVNDRPYVASSFMSVAIAQVFGSALSGRCKDKPELVQTPIPLCAKIDVLPARGDAGLIGRLFEPLGYQVEATRHTLDQQFPEWGESPYYSVSVKGTVPLSELLTHLYVLIPVFDNSKHYFIGEDELEKLLRKGGLNDDPDHKSWLEEHPERELIVRRYLKYRPSLVRQAVDRLSHEELSLADDAGRPSGDESTSEIPTPTLNQQRLDSVCSRLCESGARSVLDLGCGEGKLLRQLMRDKQFTQLTGMDVSIRTLELAHKRLKIDLLPERQARRLKLIHGSLMYRDQRLAGFDAAAVVEVIEHLDPPRLAAFERVLFEFARPETIVLTTPNQEYNVMWESLPAGKMRHGDHRFEWARAEFQEWASRVANQYGYSVNFHPVGPEDAEVGSPTQLCVFEIKLDADIQEAITNEHKS